MPNTGPPYPPPPQPGSNGIGLFQIGVSPVGDIPAFNPFDTIISQYANSPVLTALILSLNAALDQTANLDAFYDNIWNIDSAQGAGLDILGRIVGVTRILQIGTVSYFGFQEALPGSAPFNTGVTFVGGNFSVNNANQGGGSFFNGQPVTSNFRLEDAAYRQLIRAKAAFNISNSSIPAINRILLSLFPDRGNCFVTEGPAAMFMTYVFQFPLTAVEIAIVTQSGALPKPTGVHASVVVDGVAIVP